MVCSALYQPHLTVRLDPGHLIQHREELLGDAVLPVPGLATSDNLNLGQ